MKPLVIAVLISLAAVPATAQSMNVGSMMPMMSYPGDAPETGIETVTQDVSDAPEAETKTVQQDDNHLRR